MTCISLATHEASRDFTRGSNKDTFEELLRQISASSLVLCPVHGSGHWTYLAAQRAPGQEQWTLTYVDSLPAEIGTCYQAATSIAKNLKLLPADKSLPHSWPGQQRDGWSCGLWVLQDMETRIRAARKEVPARPPSIGQIMARLNEFISKIRPAAPPAAKGKAKAKPKAKASAQPVQHPSLQAALEAALSCTKCRTTKLGQKGCQRCVGDWFQMVRKAKATHGNIKKEG
jgi:hypothetical protein